MKKITYFLLMCFAIVVISCNDDDANTNSTTANVTDSEFAKNFGAELQRDFIGQVVDTQNNPIAGAQVKIGSSNVQTDANGVFILNGADVYEKFAYVTATKAGFINGSRSLVPTSGTNNIKIMLLPSAATQTIASGENTTVDLPNGTKIVFDGAFADENGNAYSGNVNVSMFHLEASDENISSLMPGMLYAKSDAGQPVGLETFGMLHAQLTGSDGQKLQIASGHTAAITMKIDNAQLATAPATIPLWHFDEVNGYWKQEGEATKQGNQYVGNVSHFSWWNCDTFTQIVSLTVTVTDENGNPIANAGVSLTRTSGMASSILSTNFNGQVSGNVPANEVLDLKVYSYTVCDSLVLHTQNIGPFATNTVLAPIALDSPNATSINVYGNLVKCDNTMVTNGYVMLQRNGNRTVCPVSNGAFEFNLLACNVAIPIIIFGYDFETYASSGFYNYNVIQNLNTGNLVCCNIAQPQSISYQLDGNAIVTVDFADTNIGIFANTSYLIVDQGPTFTLYYSGFQASGSPGSINSVILNDVNYQPVQGSVTAAFTSFGGFGQYLTGTFNGTFRDSQQVTHNISASFNVLDTN